MRTDAQYLAAARDKLGVMGSEVLGQGVRDGTVRITLITGQQYVIPLSELPAPKRKPPRRSKADG